MPEDPNPNQNNPEGISEDELRSMISTSLDEKLNERGITAEVFEKIGKLDILDSLGDLFEKKKTEPVDRESLLGDIGKLIDDKIKGISTGGGNGQPREPKIKIFG